MVQIRRKCNAGISVHVRSYFFVFREIVRVAGRIAARMDFAEETVDISETKRNQKFWLKKAGTLSEGAAYILT